MAQAALKLGVPPQHPECWAYRHIPSGLVLMNLLTLAGEMENLASVPDLSEPSTL